MINNDTSQAIDEALANAGLRAGDSAQANATVLVDAREPSAAEAGEAGAAGATGADAD